MSGAGVHVPEGWLAAASNTYGGTTYYYNTWTGQATWQPPSAPAGHKRPLEGGGEPDAKRQNQEPARVAIIVPFRDQHVEQKRAEQLQRFVPYMEAFMQRQGVEFHIYIVEQSEDGRKFNRGKLLNIGVREAIAEGHNVVVLHDVDLLPSEDLGPWYAGWPHRPVHIARRWPRYSNNPNYFGGIVAMTTKDYETINGYPNTFWGWGGEDDEMVLRLKECGLAFVAPDHGTITDLEDMDLQTKLALLRGHKEWKCMVKNEALGEHAKTWQVNGMADLRYELLERMPLGSGDNASKLQVNVMDNAGHWTDTTEAL